MKKLINYGTLLTKSAQKSIVGSTHMELDRGMNSPCSKNSDCLSGVCANFSGPMGPYGSGRRCM